MKSFISNSLLICLLTTQSGLALGQNNDLAFKTALKTLEKTQDDVAVSIIESTSLLHRLEKAIKITKVYQKAVEIPSQVYIGSTGITLGGLVFVGIGGAGMGVAASAESTGEYLINEIEHQVVSVQEGFKKSGTASVASAKPIKHSAKKIFGFGRAWLELSKKLVDNQVSRTSGKFFLNYVVKPIRWTLRKTTKLVSTGVEHSFNGLEAVANFLFQRILRFGPNTAESSAGFSAGASLVASAGYLAYTSWNRGKNLYEQEIILSDDEIKSIILNDPKTSESFEKISQELTVFFGLTADQKNKLKEVIANDLVTHKLLEYRAKQEKSDDLEKILSDYKKELSEYDLTENEIAYKLDIFKEQLLIEDSKLKDNSEKELKDYDLMKSAAKVMDEYQLATLSALSAMYDTEAAFNSIKAQVEYTSVNEVLAEIDNQISALEVIKAYISQAQAFEDVFEVEAVNAVNELVKKIDEMIELRKAELSLLEKK